MMGLVYIDKVELPHDTTVDDLSERLLKVVEEMKQIHPKAIVLLGNPCTISRRIEPKK